MIQSEIIVRIRIKPHFKKYLISKSENKVEPIRFPRKHSYNIILINLVTNYNYLTSIPIDDKENVLEYFGSTKYLQAGNYISIVLPFNDRKDIRSYNYISVENQKKFTKEVATDFYFEFSRFLIHNMTPESIRKKMRKRLVEMFKNDYQIEEDDLKLESLYRYSTRIFG